MSVTTHFPAIAALEVFTVSRYHYPQQPPPSDARSATSTPRLDNLGRHYSDAAFETAGRLWRSQNAGNTDTRGQRSVAAFGGVPIGSRHLHPSLFADNRISTATLERLRTRPEYDVATASLLTGASPTAVAERTGLRVDQVEMIVAAFLHANTKPRE